MLRYLPLVLVVAFVVYCVFDVLGSDARVRRGLPVPLWLLLVVLVPVAGGVVWLVVSRGTPHTGSAGPRGGGPVAPDDDPEFLFRLDQERRRRERQDGAADPGPHDDHVDGTGPAGTTDGTPSA
ncbi:PLDc N-terminal domain-containing protein [Cellulomonas sp. Sa3CUA2]|uniref:PLDc N-terminal domain-containing protein n=1 Tax=Cellulomonas avistercoris TaxID=2762242 RepID=A0ABR8QI06_9CELL|nr:PLDc N-terminal domain-containing protein [Cellulomonas avistercoris]MBD7920051.1 PLDc N-terminal domain-containing protein [Cellulomonas avistercoris]